MKVIVISDLVVGHYFSTALKEALSSNLDIYYVKFEELPLLGDLILRAGCLIFWLDIGCIIDKAISIEEFVADLDSLLENKGPVIWVGALQKRYGSDLIFGESLQNALAKELNGRVQALVKSSRGLFHYVDLDLAVGYVGFEKAFDLRAQKRWGALYSKVLIDHIALLAAKKFRLSRQIGKRALILDCDGVLWGGSLQEDGLHGIKVGGFGEGRLYFEFQSVLYEMYRAGALLAICSKNNGEDVLQAFEERHCPLREDCFVAMEIGWHSKAAMIESIRKRLYLSYEDVLFIDDSVEEIAAVRAELPQLDTVIFDIENPYEGLGGFSLSLSCGAGVARTAAHRISVRSRLGERKQTDDEFFKSTQCSLLIEEARESDFIRVVELTNRTNRCTNGKRILPPYKNLLDGEMVCYVVRLRDVYCSYGIIGLIGVTGDVLELFCLSCRAFGRGISQRMINYILENKLAKKCRIFDTGRNSEISKRLSECFEVLA